jgi:hypothetical protein
LKKSFVVVVELFPGDGGLHQQRGTDEETTLQQKGMDECKPIIGLAEAGQEKSSSGATRRHVW